MALHLTIVLAVALVAGPVVGLGIPEPAPLGADLPAEPDLVPVVSGGEASYLAAGLTSTASPSSLVAPQGLFRVQVPWSIDAPAGAGTRHIAFSVAITHGAAVAGSDVIYRQVPLAGLQANGTLEARVAVHAGAVQRTFELRVTAALTGDASGLASAAAALIVSGPPAVVTQRIQVLGHSYAASIEGTESRDADLQALGQLEVLMAPSPTVTAIDRRASFDASYHVHRDAVMASSGQDLIQLIFFAQDDALGTGLPGLAVALHVDPPGLERELAPLDVQGTMTSVLYTPTGDWPQRDVTLIVWAITQSRFCQGEAPARCVDEHRQVLTQVPAVVYTLPDHLPPPERVVRLLGGV